MLTRAIAQCLDVREEGFGVRRGVVGHEESLGWMRRFNAKTMNRFRYTPMTVPGVGARRMRRLSSTPAVRCLTTSL